MFQVLTSGLPLSAIELISQGMSEVFGDVDVKQLQEEDLVSDVRLAHRSANIQLVVLDKVSQDKCGANIEATKNSEKYYCYSTDKELVMFLNRKFEITLDVPEDEEDELEVKTVIQGVSQEEFDALKDKYDDILAQLETAKAQRNDIQSINSSLRNTITELNKLLEGEELVQPKEVESLKSDLESAVRDSVKAKSSLAEKEKELTKALERVSKLEKDLSSAIEGNHSLEEKYNTVKKDYSLVSEELDDYKVKYSSQAGLLKAKEDEIKSLRQQLTLLQQNQKDVEKANEEVSSYKKEIEDYKSEISSLNVELSSKESEILRLNEEVKANGIESDLVDKLKGNIEDLSSERDEALKRVSNLEAMLDSSKAETRSERLRVIELESKIQDLSLKASENDDALMTLNKENLELKNRVLVFERSRDRNENMESVLEELTDIRQKYDKLMNGVFGKISSTASPRSSSAIHLTRRGVRLRNIRFVFSGNAESRKGTYRSLLNEFKGYDSSSKILIVDVVSETSIDYVFEMQKVVSGIDWFRRGGNVQPYLSKTCLKNVQVLSPGLTYVNDSYFLTVDWEARLSELEKSGYSVVLYCGDISNIVGRILHESFADLGSSWIYVQGNAIGSRTVVANLRGLSNSSKSVVAYFDYNKQMDRFYRLVEKHNECRILSLVGGY